MIANMKRQWVGIVGGTVAAIVAAAVIYSLPEVFVGLVMAGCLWLLSSLVDTRLRWFLAGLSIGASCWVIFALSVVYKG